MINLIFDIAPTPKQSVRFAGGQAYQKASVVKIGKAITLLAKQQLPKGFEPFKDCALKAEVIYVFAHNKSISKRELQAILEGEQTGNYVRKFTKPDVTDNLNKLLFDALEGLIYANDSQISELHAIKVYGSKSKIILKITQL